MAAGAVWAGLLIAAGGRGEAGLEDGNQILPGDGIAAIGAAVAAAGKDGVQGVHVSGLLFYGRTMVGSLRRGR